MAEYLLRHLGGDKFEVFSAGISPTQVNPLAIKVMAEIGIPISSQKSKSVSEFIGKKIDYVITLCDNARESCPIFSGNYEKIHWNLEDPALAKGAEDEKLRLFRKIRDQIKKHITKFLINNY